MKLIVTHEQPDFDALAGLALASLAHPGASAVIDGDLPDNVRAFLRLYRDELDLRDPDEIDVAGVTELIVVDTNDSRRLGRFADLVESVPVTVYDHHPSFDGEIAAAHGIQERVGATATLLTRHLEASMVVIPAHLATLALLAIHEDTGNLTFGNTTAHDYSAAAALMNCGASLDVVREFESDFTGQEQLEFFGAAIRNSRVERAGDFTVAVAVFDYPQYVRNAAGACARLLAERATDAALLVVTMEGKTLVFARVVRGFDAGAALSEAFGGGGHPGAAFARTQKPAAKAAEVALSALEQHQKPALVAGDIMTTPVKTIGATAEIGEAQTLLSQYGHNGLPVVDEEERLVGVISRRDLERAMRHDLARSQVSGFMSKEVVSAEPRTTVAQLERLVEEHNIGRVPIVSEGRLVGIVTRSDLLASHHDAREPEVPELVCDRLPSEARRVVTDLKAILRESAGRTGLYLVGGTVRDALLGRALVDLDLVCEGIAAEKLVATLQRRLGGIMRFHASFGTSSLELPSGLTVDIAEAREEFYPHPGALPSVTASSMRKDLSRRDYTVNAIAVRLWPEPLALIDPFDGLADLRRATLRLLHPLSFIEDPTRILRGARLASRLGFELARSAAERAREALEPEVLGRVSRSRLRAELELILAERKVTPVLRLLDELGMLAAAYRIGPAEQLTGELDRLRGEREIPDLAYLLALLVCNSAERSSEFIEAFHWPRRLITSRERLVRAKEEDDVSDEWLEEADEAELALLQVLSPSLASRLRTFQEVPRRRKVRGRDVLELGLPPGPEVGEILADIANARQSGLVNSFEDEIELARRRVAERLGRRARE